MEKETRNKIVDALYEGSLNGGVTLTRDGSKVDSGYVVATPMTEENTKCCEGEDLRSCIEGFVDNNLMSLDANSNLGAWYDEEEDRYVLDVTRRVNTQRTATLIGWLFRQKAIYDLDTNEEIFI